MIRLFEPSKDESMTWTVDHLTTFFIFPCFVHIGVLT
jgi:hypothetical protein